MFVQVDGLAGLDCLRQNQDIVAGITDNIVADFLISTHASESVDVRVRSIPIELATVTSMGNTTETKQQTVETNKGNS